METIVFLRRQYARKTRNEKNQIKVQKVPNFISRADALKRSPQEHMCGLLLSLGTHMHSKAPRRVRGALFFQSTLFSCDSIKFPPLLGHFRAVECLLSCS